MCIRDRYITNVKFRSTSFNLFFNDNLATQHAVVYATNVMYNGTSLAFIPPKSFCFFKCANIKPGSKCYLKDLYDMDTLLQYISADQLGKINYYVLESLKRLRGTEDCEQIKEWKTLYTNALAKRDMD
eukprot:TRINITY_DN3513_c0_g3_i2.p1 TRINITY_DN3513_c0_g3~~TRINITY_DN3513_c0_g3_i2.p1  ORF type:complete len:128 (+),score=9.00 TRINITY_DN3513_c0_g3_i2:38-421(+)